jgi:hypothetical protein
MLFNLHSNVSEEMLMPREELRVIAGREKGIALEKQTMGNAIALV